MSMHRISGASREFSQCISRSSVTNKPVLELRGRQQTQLCVSAVSPTLSRPGLCPGLYPGRRQPRVATLSADRRCFVGCVAKLIDSFFNNYS